MNEQLLIELNNNLNAILHPTKKTCKTNEEKIEEYGKRIEAKYAKKHLKNLLNK